MAEDDTKYRRLVQTSVTNFLYCGDRWLFLKRSPSKRIDPNRLNGVGGRLEAGENYLQAAIRETQEETGYIVSEKDVKLAGVVKLIGGYAEDWVMCFFKIKVDSLEIPKKTGSEDDGELLWLNREEIFDPKFELVDDLNYSFKLIENGEKIFFMTALLDDNQKIYSNSISLLDI